MPQGFYADTELHWNIFYSCPPQVSMWHGILVRLLINSVGVTHVNEHSCVSAVLICVCVWMGALLWANRNENKPLFEPDVVSLIKILLDWRQNEIWRSRIFIGSQMSDWPDRNQTTCQFKEEFSVDVVQVRSNRWHEMCSHYELTWEKVGGCPGLYTIRHSPLPNHSSHRCTRLSSPAKWLFFLHLQTLRQYRFVAPNKNSLSLMSLLHKQLQILDS